MMQSKRFTHNGNVQCVVIPKAHLRGVEELLGVLEFNGRVPGCLLHIDTYFVFNIITKN